MVLPFWWLERLTEQTRLLLASWLMCVKALLGMFHLPAFLMSFVTSNVLIPCLSKDPRVFRISTPSTSNGRTHFFLKRF